MSESALTRMADILPPDAPIEAAGYGGIGWLLFSVLVLGLLVYFFSRWHENRHQRLLNAVRSGKLNARAAAHELSRDRKFSSHFRQKLDRLRFQSAPPTPGDLQALLRQADKHD